MSRHAFDVLERENARLCAERSDLQGRLASLTESMVRIQRASVGMSEAPRAPLPPPELPPPEVANHIMGIGDSRIRAMVSGEIFRRRVREGGWDGVIADIQRKDMADVGSDSEAS